MAEALSGDIDFHKDLRRGDISHWSTRRSIWMANW